MKILGIIPARSGSKGIKNKNIVDIGEKPLIAYTIVPALKACQEKIIDKVIVSTDSQEIADISKRFDADVPFLRPEALSQDSSKSVDFMLHAINFYKEKNEIYNAVMLLQPTCPLRTVDDIRLAVELFKSNENDSLISTYKEDYINELVSYRKENNRAIPLNLKHNRGVRRQNHEALYVRNGAIYISRSDLIEKGFIIGDKPLMYEMLKLKSINIDTIDDLEIAKVLLCK